MEAEGDRKVFDIKIVSNRESPTYVGRWIVLRWVDGSYGGYAATYGPFSSEIKARNLAHTFVNSAYFQLKDEDEKF